MRIRSYLIYIEPEGGKPSALYQNPGSISFFFCKFNMSSCESEHISFEDRIPSDRISPMASAGTASEKTVLYIGGPLSSLLYRRNTPGHNVFVRMRSYLLYIERADTECSLSESGHYYFFSVNPRCLHVNQIISPLYWTRIGEIGRSPAFTKTTPHVLILLRLPPLSIMLFFAGCLLTCSRSFLNF